jgi:hypothetical protein
MTKQKPKIEEFVVVTEGECEECGYDYSKDHLTKPADDWAVICPKCGKYSQNWDADYSHIPPDRYDLEKENYKKCPVCGEIIDYHVDGFIHYKDENVWIHREHTVEETEKALNRPLTDMEKAWITL